MTQAPEHGDGDGSTEVDRWRHDIVFRSRKAGHPTEPGTGGRKWRRIGVPY